MILTVLIGLPTRLSLQSLISIHLRHLWAFLKSIRMNLVFFLSLFLAYVSVCGVCVNVYTWSCVWVHMYEGASACGGQRLTGVFLNRSPPGKRSQGLSLGPIAPWFSQPSRPSCTWILSQPTEFWSNRRASVPLRQLCGFIFSWQASISTEPSSQPQRLLPLKFAYYWSQQDGSAGKGSWYQAWQPEFSPVPTHTVKGVSRLLQAVLYTGTAACAPTHIK